MISHFFLHRGMTQNEKPYFRSRRVPPKDKGEIDHARTEKKTFLTGWPRSRKVSVPARNNAVSDRRRSDGCCGENDKAFSNHPLAKIRTTVILSAKRHQAITISGGVK